MSEIAETVSEAVEKGKEGDGHDRMNSFIALMVAVIATFMALCNVKDGNIVQAMAQDQASVVDEWALYQAKGTKLNLAKSVLDQLTLERDLRPELSADARARCIWRFPRSSRSDGCRACSPSERMLSDPLLSDKGPLEPPILILRPVPALVCALFQLREPTLRPHLVRVIQL
jgi:hypothetical protein